jgi:TorA maturation chaperone TorD
MNVLRPLEHWDRGFESISRHECLCLFCVCIGSGLATGWSPIQGVLPTVLGLRNWPETKRFMDALCSKVGATGKREREITYTKMFINNLMQSTLCYGSVWLRISVLLLLLLKASNVLWTKHLSVQCIVLNLLMINKVTQRKSLKRCIRRSIFRLIESLRHIFITLIR